MLQVYISAVIEQEWWIITLIFCDTHRNSFIPN